MKKILFCSLWFSYLCGSAVAMTPGKFLLWQSLSDGYTDSSCKRGINLILDEGKYLGKFALIYDVISNESKVIPGPERFYPLTKVEEDSCHVKIYKGTRETVFERVTLIIIDNRKNKCKEVSSEKIITVHERNSRGEIVSFVGEY